MHIQRIIVLMTGIVQAAFLAASYQATDAVLPDAINRKDTLGRTVLHRSVEKNTSSTEFLFTQGLIKAGADVNMQDNFGLTPLYIAMTYKNVEPKVVKLLIQSGAHTKAIDELGRTALQCAYNQARKEAYFQGIVKRNLLKWVQKKIVARRASLTSSTIKNQHG